MKGCFLPAGGTIPPPYSGCSVGYISVPLAGLGNSYRAREARQREFESLLRDTPEYSRFWVFGTVIKAFFLFGEGKQQTPAPLRGFIGKSP